MDRLLRAIERGDRRAVATLLQRRPELVNNAFKDGKSPLEVAIKTGVVEVSQVLIQKGADVNQIGNSTSPLHLAVKKADYKTALLLLNVGAKVDICVPKEKCTGLTPLTLAVGGGHKSICKLLLKWKANPNFQCNCETSPMLLAHLTGRVDIIEILKQYGGRFTVSQKTRFASLMGQSGFQRDELTEVVSRDRTLNEEEKVISWLENNGFEKYVPKAKELQKRKKLKNLSIIAFNAYDTIALLCVSSTDRQRMAEALAGLAAALVARRSVDSDRDRIGARLFGFPSVQEQTSMFGNYETDHLGTVHDISLLVSFFNSVGIEARSQSIDSTKSIVLHTIENFLNSETKVFNTFLLYFTGHGDEEGYLRPTEGLSSDECKVSLESILSIWDESSAKRSSSNNMLIIINDSCHSGSWVDKARKLRLPDVAVQAACLSGERTLDFFFTKQFVEYQEKKVSYSSLKKKFTKNKSTPCFYSPFKKSEFTFIGANRRVGTSSDKRRSFKLIQM